MKKTFLSWVWFFEVRRLQASWAVLGKGLAQLAGYLLSSKNHIHERNCFQTNFLSNIMKKSTTFINDMLLNFSTLPTLVCIFGSIRIRNNMVNWCMSMGQFPNKVVNTKTVKQNRTIHHIYIHKTLYTINPKHREFFF